jgi:hypothetical protein
MGVFLGPSNSAIVAFKQPEATCKQMSVAVFQYNLTYEAGHRPLLTLWNIVG